MDASIFDKKYGTVLDSGTTYAYLPSQAFDAFEEAVSDSSCALIGYLGSMYLAASLSTIAEQICEIMKIENDGSRLGGFLQVIQQLGSLQAVDGPDPAYHDICYAGAGT